MMHRIRVLDSGLVYRNPKPAVYSRQAYFPTLVQLPNGEMLVGMDIGSAFEAFDVRSYLTRSPDGGTTWTNPQLVFQPDEANHRVSTSCRISATGSGDLLGWVCQFDRTAEEGLANPNTGGFCHTDFGILRSRDRGRTWCPVQQVTLPVEWRHFEICAPPFDAGDGRLLVVTSPWPDWMGRPSPWGQDGLGFVSTDDGRSWTELISIFQDASRRCAFFEQAMTRLSDGRLMATCWVYDTESQRSLPNRAAFSDDKGRSFSTALETPLFGETCRPLGLDGNHVFVVYRRVDQPGLWAHLSRIDGGCWTPISDSLLWSGQPSQHLQPVNTMAHMSVLKFGCPAIIKDHDGLVFVVFWCVENCVSCIRWFRIEVEV